MKDFKANANNNPYLCMLFWPFIVLLKNINIDCK